MGGAMAGSAICSTRAKSNSLDVVTVTINNVCNLNCPHCYLQYAGNCSLIDAASVSQIIASSFRHLCIVGMEPLANRESVELVEKLISDIITAGRSISLITNGLNLRLLSAEALKKLSWIDVSIDGSRRSYQGYRGGSYEKLLHGIQYALTSGLRDLRVLHTISSANVGYLRDMLLEAFDMGSSLVAISPFQTTRATRPQNVEMLEPRHLLSALLDTGLASDARLRLILDPGYLQHFDSDDVLQLAEKALGERFVHVASDPIERGLIRITYDGLVLTPLEAINTVDYVHVGRALKKHALNEWFDIMRSEHKYALAQCH